MTVVNTKKYMGVNIDSDEDGFGEDDDEEFSIVRKPPEKLLAMAMIVHDSDYVSEELLERGPPLFDEAPLVHGHGIGLRARRGADLVPDPSSSSDTMTAAVRSVVAAKSRPI